MHVFCAVLAWSRFRFVRFAADEKAATTLGMLAECFEVLGGVPKIVLADRAIWPRAECRWRRVVEGLQVVEHRELGLVPAGEPAEATPNSGIELTYQPWALRAGSSCRRPFPESAIAVAAKPSRRSGFLGAVRLLSRTPVLRRNEDATLSQR